MPASRNTTSTDAKKRLPPTWCRRSSAKLGFYDHPTVQKSFVRGTKTPARPRCCWRTSVAPPACGSTNACCAGLDGVIDVDLDYASHHARVRWDPERIKLSEILESILNIGYVAHPTTRRDARNSTGSRKSAVSNASSSPA